MKDYICEKVQRFLNNLLGKTLKRVRECFTMQLDYINIMHPGFVAARKRVLKEVENLGAYDDDDDVSNQKRISLM